MVTNAFGKFLKPIGADVGLNVKEQIGVKARNGGISLVCKISIIAMASACALTSDSPLAQLTALTVIRYCVPICEIEPSRTAALPNGKL